MKHPTVESFLKDVATHELQVVLDQGVHRHLVLKRPGSVAYSFQITTWPGHLAITGDMGAYMFRRLEDMFNFHRCDKIEDVLSSKLGYWREKLQAPEAKDVMRWDADSARRALQELLSGWVDEYLQEHGNTEESRLQVAEITQQYRRDLVNSADDEFEFWHAVRDWRCQDEGPNLEDIGEHGMNVASYHFVWACLAIAWAIQQYDARKQQEVAA